MNQYSNLGALSALLYDWHNSYCLHSQKQDVDFWIQMLPPKQRVVVMGAGTGRVAVPLAKVGHQVIAIDRDRYRLDRIPNIQNLEVLEADFLTVQLETAADQVIFPYSALQLVPPIVLPNVLKNVTHLLVPHGQIWIDVSSRFSIRVDHPMKTVLDNYCSELGVVLLEQQQGIHKSDHYCINRIFSEGNKPLIEITERWYFLEDEVIRAEFARCGLSLMHHYSGYGTPETKQRRIYQLSI